MDVQRGRRKKAVEYKRKHGRLKEDVALGILALIFFTLVGNISSVAPQAATKTKEGIEIELGG